ncbi:hypothetical protein CCH79_00017123 [Gambusia affinis]|uniref:Uncharacterized protein n=1 Tax=Gambusia affinis TaxID=33528 RepID=A0A315URS3_GAMAF|nr:hypothetical protein CCH79_00017123 [Gambusia affinis]
MAEQMLDSILCCSCAAVTQYVCVFRSIFPIHPSFRVLALAEPPVVGASSSSTSSSSRGQQQWLGPELLTMFLYHSVSPLAKAEETGLIQGLSVRLRPQVPGVPEEAAERLLHLTHSLRQTNDPTVSPSPPIIGVPPASYPSVSSW